MKDGLKSVKDQSVVLSFTPSERFSTDYRLNNAGIFLDVMTSHCRKQDQCSRYPPPQCAHLQATGIQLGNQNG